VPTEGFTVKLLILKAYNVRSGGSNELVDIDAAIRII
jgi:hypothetical protein